MAGATHDDGFHEIQLNGKQLVFLFMAVTVVSVVIFLCGVLVGRGVRLDRAVPIESPTRQRRRGSTAACRSTGAENSNAAGRGQARTLTFTQRLESTEPADREARAGRRAGCSSRSRSPRPRPLPAPAPRDPRQRSRRRLRQPPAVSPAAARRAGGTGVAVQVSAFRVRQEADALANRLIGKGYAAYVVPPAPGAPALFRVRVGKFKEQREADQGRREAEERRAVRPLDRSLALSLRRAPGAVLPAIRPRRAGVRGARSALGGAERMAAAAPTSLPGRTVPPRLLPRARSPASCTSPAPSTGPARRFAPSAAFPGRSPSSRRSCSSSTCRSTSRWRPVSPRVWFAPSAGWASRSAPRPG